MLQWKYVCIGTDPVNIYWCYTVIIETMNVLGIYNYQFFFFKIGNNIWIHNVKVLHKKLKKYIASQPGLFLYLTVCVTVDNANARNLYIYIYMHSQTSIIQKR